MPGRTRTQLRQLVAQQFPLPFVSGTTVVSTTTSNLIDAANTPNLGQFADDALIGQWIYVTSTTAPSTRNLRITNSVQSTGTLTFIPALAAVLPDASTYEILPASAPAIHTAIDEALLTLYDRGIIVRPILDRSLVTGSPIYNAGFAHWTDAAPADAYTAATYSTTHGPRGWTIDNVTVLKEVDSSRLSGSESALRMTRIAGTAGNASLQDQWYRFLYDFRGNSVTLYAWVLTSTASFARISLQEFSSSGVSTTTYSSYHSGSGYFERLSVALSTSSTFTGLVPACQTADIAGNATFTDMWIDGGEPVYEYPIVIANMPEGPDEIWTIGTGNDVEKRQLGTRIPVSQWQFYKHYNEQQASDIGTLWLSPSIASGKRLLVKASGPLTLPTADTHNIEITQFESLLVAKMAALKIIEGRLVGATGAAIRNLSVLGARLAQDVERLSQGLGGQVGASSLSPDWTT